LNARPAQTTACRTFGSGDDGSSSANAMPRRTVQRDDRTRIRRSGIRVAPAWDLPEQILPVQFAELLQRSVERTHELRLMAAVLEDAIRTFCRCSGSAGVRRRRLFRETADWFESPDVSWPFSFENICDALALEPGWVRRLLRRWQAAQTPRAQGLAKIPSVRRIAGSRHTVTGRAPGLRDSRRLAS